LTKAAQWARQKWEVKIMMVSRIGAIAATTIALGFVAAPAKAAELFSIKSSTFADGKTMPKKVANSTANAPTNANCVGENISPQFSWSNVPDGTKSFAFLMIDPEGRAPGGVNHRVAYGIPASVTGFAEGEVSKPNDKYVGGKSTQGVGFYSGPCTPPNATAHHYTFVLIATDFDPKELPPGLTRDELTAKFGPAPAHLKGSTGMIGLFVNPWHE
jgi:Raf kinase inhibitor-like YbhB/YbcL family protein